VSPRYNKGGYLPGPQRVGQPLAEWETQLLAQVTEQQRRDRAESLRLTQAALRIDITAVELPALAHWVHTGRDMLQHGADPDVSPDAARWRPGGQR
jgi:hypothetical protein